MAWINICAFRGAPNWKKTCFATTLLFFSFTQWFATICCTLPVNSSININNVVVLCKCRCIFETKTTKYTLQVLKRYWQAHKKTESEKTWDVPYPTVGNSRSNVWSCDCANFVGFWWFRRFQNAMTRGESVFHIELVFLFFFSFVWKS